MSWLYLQALAGDCSEADCSVGERSAPSSMTPTDRPSSSRAKRTAASILSQSGRTFAILTDARGVESWMSSQAASHASRFPSQESSEAMPTNAICGRTRSESFARWDRDTRCWRTSQGCLFTPISEPYSETWPRAGSMFDGAVYRRPNWEHRISAIGSGLWPTPVVRDGRGGLDGGSNSRKAAKARGMWPTPRSTDGSHGGRVTPRKSKNGGNLIEAVAKETFPAPSARDWKSSNASPETMAKNARPLNETVTGGRGGQLNPAWVEWLMGWPSGWTDLAPSVTDRFHEWLQQHGGC
jgi:hypothetical protein